MGGGRAALQGWPVRRGLVSEQRIPLSRHLVYKEQEMDGIGATMPESMVSYQPMVNLVGGLTALAGLTAFVPGLMGAEVHTPYLNGFMDIPFQLSARHPEPENALTVACWDFLCDT